MKLESGVVPPSFAQLPAVANAELVAPVQTASARSARVAVGAFAYFTQNSMRMRE